MPARSSARLPADLVGRAARQALREDVGSGDLTTRWVVPKGSQAVGTIRSKQGLVVAGLPLAKEVFRQVDSRLRFVPLAREGDRLPRGASVAQVRGRASSILRGERVALNFLQHLSGIATKTAGCVARSRRRCAVRDTRKTHPGLRALEKYAVLVGGGENHRLRLDDGVLIKHNHWRVSGGVGASVRRAKEARGSRGKLPIQVEVSTLKDLREALEAGVDAILLDNLTPREARRAVTLARGKAFLEISGGITEASLPAFANLRPDAISMGALTHSAPWVDFSLTLEASP